MAIQDHQATARIVAKHRIFAVPYDRGLHSLVPTARIVDHPRDGKLLAVPHEIDTTKLARNLGYRVQAPVITQYDWAGDKPWRSQKITVAMLSMNKRAYVLSEMGTGKTRSALHAANYLMLQQEVRRTLVVAPISTMWSVWEVEVMKHFGHLSTGVLYGSRAQRRKKLAQEHDIYIINHDGIATILPDLVARDDIDLVVCDELGFLRTPNTDRWKAHNALFANRKYVWGLTGSPTPNEPCDAWAQIRLLTPHTVPKSFMNFKRETMRQITQFMWIERDEAKDIVFDAMQPAVRFKRSDCAEIPPVSFIDRPVKMSAQQERIYKLMMSKLQVMFAAGEITAANEGVLFSKLLQISSGYVYTKNRNTVALDNSDRVDQLMEIIDEAEGKVIVFCDFIHTAMGLYGLLEYKHGGKVGLVTGSTAAKQRATIFHNFQNNRSPRVLVAHPKCMAHGLTLTAANTIVWFTPTTSLETYEQACARITRPGQLNKQLIFHLTGSKVEAKLYRRLQKKKSLQGALLEMFEAQES